MPSPVNRWPGHEPALAGMVYWILGLPSARKAALVAAFSARLAQLGHTVTNLHGDRLRQTTGTASVSDPSARLRLAGLYGELCKDIAGRGAAVICATSGLLHEARLWNRRNLPRYKEIHVRAREEMAARRSLSPPCPAADQDRDDFLLSDATLAPHIVIDDDGAASADDVALELLRRLRRLQEAA